MIKGKCSKCGIENYITEEDNLCYRCNLMENKILVVDMEFNDGLTLQNCVIFNDDPKQGDTAIQNEKIVYNKFKKLPWYSKWDGWIYFQNNNINGYCHNKNIKSFTIKYIYNSNF